MVGAEREVYERIKPAFKHWAALVIHAGEPGAGTRMKLARNMLTFTSYAAACEAMKLAEAAGLDLQALGRVVRHTDALTGGPGAIMVRDNMNDLEPGQLPVPALPAHPRAGREGPESGAGAGRGGIGRPAPGRDSLRAAGRRAWVYRTQRKRREWTNCAARASRR